MINPTLSDQIELAIRAGTVRALHTRANGQRRKATEGTAAAGDQFPGVVIRSPEAAMAANLADAFLRIADQIEAEEAQ